MGIGKSNCSRGGIMESFQNNKVAIGDQITNTNFWELGIFGNATSQKQLEVLPALYMHSSRLYDPKSYFMDQ